MSAWHSPEEVAEHFGITRRKVMANAAAGVWPHWRQGREVRFSDEHIASIEAAHEVGKKLEPDNPWGVKGRRAS